MKFKKGSSNTGDYTVKDDPTHENYMALLTAIMIEEDTPDYKKLVYNKLLFDKREEKRRLEEIDEIRAKGGKTELEVWYRKSIEKYCKNGKESLFVQRKFKKEAERRAEKNLQKKNELFNKFSQNTINIEICVNPDSSYYKAVQNAINLTIYLMEKENIPLKNVVRHYDVTRKNCPRRIIKENQWNTFKDKLKGLEKPVSLQNGNYKGIKAKVNTSVLNVRYDRGTNHKIIGKLKLGDVVKLNYCLDKWVSIEGYKGSKGLGYIHSDYIKIIGD